MDKFAASPVSEDPSEEPEHDTRPGILSERTVTLNATRGLARDGGWCGIIEYVSKQKPTTYITYMFSHQSSKIRRSKPTTYG